MLQKFVDVLRLQILKLLNVILLSTNQGIEPPLNICTIPMKRIVYLSRHFSVDACFGKTKS